MSMKIYLNIFIFPIAGHLQAKDLLFNLNQNIRTYPSILQFCAIINNSSLITKSFKLLWFIFVRKLLIFDERGEGRTSIYTGIGAICFFCELNRTCPNKQNNSQIRSGELTPRKHSLILKILSMETVQVETRLKTPEAPFFVTILLLRILDLWHSLKSGERS